MINTVHLVLPRNKKKTSMQQQQQIQESSTFDDDDNNINCGLGNTALYLSSSSYLMYDEFDEYDDNTTRLTPTQKKKNKPPPRGEKKRSAPGRSRDLESLKFARTDAINGEVGSRAAITTVSTNDGEKNVIVAFSSRVDHSVGSAGDAVTVYCPRGKYSAKKWDNSRKISQVAAIVKGKEFTPQVNEGCKRIIARAAVIGMLNASYRSISSPLRVTENIEKVKKNLFVFLFSFSISSRTGHLLSKPSVFSN